jgi:DNA-binding beta-propeller fold protein YncE
VKQRAVISKRFNTVTLLRTMEEVLGIKPLGLNDAVQPPMSEVFSTHQATWNYKARVPEVLRTTKLPLPAAKAENTPVAEPSHNANYWTYKTKGFDFSAEDKVDPESFNMVLWKGLKGEGEPYPTERNGRDLSKQRGSLLREFKKKQSHKKNCRIGKKDAAVLF